MSAFPFTLKYLEVQLKAYTSVRRTSKAADCSKSLSRTSHTRRLSSSLHNSLLCVLSALVWDGPVCHHVYVFLGQHQCSRVSETETSLSDVASTDIESSDTATESAEWCRHCRGHACIQDWQSVSVQSVRQCHRPARQQLNELRKCLNVGHVNSTQQRVYVLCRPRQL